MPDVTIVNVPEGAEEQVKYMASVAIERHLRNKVLKVEPQKEDEFKAAMDDFCVANDMEPKFNKPEIEMVDPVQLSPTPNEEIDPSK